MLEIVVLAILVLAVAGSAVLVAANNEIASRTWPLVPTEYSRSEPADEGALVAEEAPQIQGEVMRKAA
jgi:hypothetical protein